MGRFLFGVLSGVILIIFLGIVAVAAALSFRSRPPMVADGSTLILRLSGDVPEKPALDLPFAFLNQHDQPTIESVWSLLHRAAADSRIKALVFEPEHISTGWAKMQEIHADLEEFRKSGKPAIAYLTSPGTRDYYIASACSRIYLGPSDLLDLKGVAVETMYFKNALDKLGVKVDVEHAGKYKDFGDMFTTTSMSPETREVMNGLADAIYGDLVNTIAKDRRKDAARVRAILDDGPFLAKQALAAGLVDSVRYEDQVLGELSASLHENNLKRISGQDYVNVPEAAVDSAKNRIAYVVGEGGISRGNTDLNDVTDIGGSGIESGDFDRMLARAGNDATIKGVLVRINSPGGDVPASDDMWRAMNELRRKKPVVISMSDAAASGGYYMAMSGDPIVAYPATITGSIGVVFGKPNLHGLYDKLGISKDYVSRGRFALIDSDYESLSEAGSRKLREGIDAIYEDFVAKVAAARRKPAAEIEPLAQGRVWLGTQARESGLVDALGGLDRAVELLKARAGIPAAERVNFVLYPPRRSLLDMIFRSASYTDPAALIEARLNEKIDAMLSLAGAGTLRTAWRDAGLRVWLRGGMLRTMPFTIAFR